MQKKNLFKAAVAVGAAALITVPAALAAGSKPATVTVRVEGKTKTLLAATTVKTAAGSIVRGGAPAGKCPSTSVQGALQDATHGRWVGSWSSSYGEYYITGILGQTEATAKDYWAIYVNGVYAAAGACDIALRTGEHVLFAVIPGSGKTPLALSVSLPPTGKDGKTVSAKVVYFSAKGHKHVLAGARVTLGSKTVKTGSRGVTPPITLKGSGVETLKVSKPGYVRSEATITVS